MVSSFVNTIVEQMLFPKYYIYYTGTIQLGCKKSKLKFVIVDAVKLPLINIGH